MLIKKECLTVGLLLLILFVLAITIRIPGLFWGQHKMTQGQFLYLHYDEATFATQARDFIESGRLERKDYLLGLLRETQIALRILTPAGDAPTTKAVLFTTRYMNIIFGCATVILIFLFSLSLFGNRMTAFLSSLILAFAPLHVIHSHYATPLASFVFWFWLALFCFYQYETKDGLIWWYIAWIAVAASTATKFGILAALPGIYILLANILGRRKGLILQIIAILLGILFFQYMNFWYSPLEFYEGMIKSTIPDSFYERSYPRWINLFSYSISLFPALGLAATLMSAFGFIRLKRKGFYDWRSEPSQKRLIILDLPLLLQLCFTLLLTSSFERHLLVFLPYLAIVASSALAVVFKPKNIRWAMPGYLLGGLLILYQVTASANLEYQHYSNRYYLAADWLKRQLKPGEKIFIPSSVAYFFIYREIIPEEWLVDTPHEADYLLISENMTWKLGRSSLNLFNPTPNNSEIYHWRNINSLEEIKSILSGKGDFSLVATFSSDNWLPEYILYKNLLHSFVLWCGDVWIYRRKDQ